MKGQNTEFRLSFSKAFSGGNAVISPELSDDFYFTLIGSGTIARQNEAARKLVAAVNTYPAVEDLVKALTWMVDLQGKASNGFPLSENELRDWSVANHAARSALTRYRELAGTSNEGAKS